MPTSINKLHVSIAAVVGIILGSSVTFAALNSGAQQQTAQQVELSQKNEQLRSDIQQLQSTLDENKQSASQTSQQQQEAIQALTQELNQLKDQKKKVEKTLVVQKKKAVTLKTENKELAKTTELQSDLYDQSHELFEKQTTLEDQVAKLSTTRDKLATQNEKFAKECKLFKEGTSWDPKSDSCDKEKLATEQLVKLNTSITKKTQELADVNALISKLGVKD
ncbi:hypothetical protein [Vibrio rumoiensis]|uniref:Chromosome partitioning protein ParA n=1 Tax=Vibrio rumoiensis 1S-45 TaxID=1188252 RepID=A0A1E5E0V2_9VIBR|nr:hypothetical protein [Vibrio rumoiensis]OEF24109.1 hypothetical protein A1QC_10720 [Vibrio rumoiensis 1S-45]